MGGVFVGGLSYAALQGAIQASDDTAPVAMPTPRKPLTVKPVLFYDLPQRQEKTSWRSWGGVQTTEVAEDEVSRIKSELNAIKQRADFPIDFLEISAMHHAGQLQDHPDLAQCDALLVYGAGGGVDGVQNFGKDVIMFQRWKSGPVYLQYEIVSPWFLRRATDKVAIQGIDNSDVVTDDTTELDWRFRALCGLKNTMNSKIIVIGGVGAWGQPADVVSEKVKEIWNYEYHVVDYDELGRLIREAKADEKVMARAKKRADAYLKIPGTTLETTNDFFTNSFILDDVFRALMQKVGTNLITVGACMVTIMPTAETSACLALSMLNDDGFLAFCESDFVVVPSGVLLGNISGKPVFLNDPTYPHQNIITLAHCTGPRRMDGKSYDPARIVTHFESDYGAAPHVEVPLGMVTTNIIPDFKSERWVGLKGTICDVPFRPICRTQFDIRYKCSDELLAERMPGFHWMTCFGDYRKELGYALRRVGIQWDNLDKVPRDNLDD